MPAHRAAVGGLTTMIGSVRQNGGTASMTVEGALNAEVFRSYIREILLPTLSPGDLLVMDNLSAHKDREALGLLEEAGVKARFLPAYSPDLNPIELMWNKVKALLRKAEARTPETLLLAIGDVPVADDSKRCQPSELRIYLERSRDAELR